MQEKTPLEFGPAWGNVLSYKQRDNGSFLCSSTWWMVLVAEISFTWPSPPHRRECRAGQPMQMGALGRGQWESIKNMKGSEKGLTYCNKPALMLVIIVKMVSTRWEKKMGEAQELLNNRIKRKTLSWVSVKILLKTKIPSMASDFSFWDEVFLSWLLFFFLLLFFSCIFSFGTDIH